MQHGRDMSCAADVPPTIKNAALHWIYDAMFELSYDTFHEKHGAAACNNPALVIVSAGPPISVEELRCTSANPSEPD